MKRFFTMVAATFMATIVLQAQDLNIYASGLSAGAVDNTDKEVKISYTLNAPATTLEVILQETGEAALAPIAITDPAALTKGAHTDIVVDLTGVPTGNYAWSIKAEGAANTAVTKVSDESSKYKFYFPIGLAVDNSFESPYFGRIYVSEGAGSDYEGAGAASYWAAFGDGTRVSHDGIYIFTPTLDAINTNSAYTGNIAWETGSLKFAVNTDGGGTSPGRISVAADGKVYIADNSPANSGVYIMDPANPENDFDAVFATDSRDAAGLVTVGTDVTHGRIPAIAVKGSGSNTVLYTIDSNYIPDGSVTNSNSGSATFMSSGKVFSYTIGNSTELSIQPSIFFENPNTSDNFGSLLTDRQTLIADSRGGFWILQYRGSNSVNLPILMYLNSSGQKYTFVSTLTAGTVANTERCAMALNKAENLLAISHVKSSRVYVEFFDVTYDDDTYLPSIAVSSITEIPHTDIKSTQYNATNADALAFDVADNLYVACASTEILRAFALPKADNSFTTPAPSASTIEVSVASGIGSQVAGKAVKSVQYFDLTGKPATGATKGFVIKKTIYEDGSIKNSKAVK